MISVARPILNIQPPNVAPGAGHLQGVPAIGVNGAYGERGRRAEGLGLPGLLDSRPADTVAAQLARCDREIAEMAVQAGEPKAFLVTLGMEDWRREQQIILAELPFDEWPLVWAWRARPLRRLDERESRYYRWPCRVLARARRMNTVHVEFPDGFVAITSGNGLRRRDRAPQRAVEPLRRTTAAGSLSSP